jgi:LDH2 family malate/lactate/ureidoglycolate dehydrogenase
LLADCHEVQSKQREGQSMPKMHVESAEFLHRLYTTVWRAYGAPEHQVEVFARCILQGDLLGRVNQGVAIAEIVHFMVNAGMLDPAAEPDTVSEGPVHTVLDGSNCLGQYAMTRAVETAMDKAAENAIGITWLRNFNDIGPAAAYSRLALERDMVCYLAINSVPLAAPFGGRDFKCGVGPMSVACPAGKEQPILFDGFFAGTYDGYMANAVMDGRKLPKDSLIDPDTGELTDDPVPYITDITSRIGVQKAPTVFSAPKMYGMSVVQEVLAGFLGLGAVTSNLIPYPADEYAEGGTQNSVGGGYVQVFDPSKLMPLEDFKAKVDGYIRDLKASRLDPRFDEVLLPGELEWRAEARHLKEGVPMRQEYWDNFLRMATQVGIDPDDLRD